MMKKYKMNPLQFNKPVYWHHYNIRLGLNGVYFRKWLMAYYENRFMKIMPNTKDKKVRK